MAIPFWSAKYKNLRFREWGRDVGGVDCWGLVRLIMIEQFGFSLPSFSRDYSDYSEVKEISNLIKNEMFRFKPIESGQEQCGDIVVFHSTKDKEILNHIGFVVGDNQMLHIERLGKSCLTNYINRGYVHGFFRYVKPTFD